MGSDDLQQARSRICDIMIAASAFFAVPALASSLFRITTVGWQWTMGVHIAATVFMWILFLYRKSIAYRFRGSFIVSIFLVLGLAGFWKHGMVAGANPMLLVSPILATVLFGKRLGIAFATVIVSMMVFTVYSFVWGGRVFVLDTGMDKTYLPAWITYLLSVVLSIAAAIAAISMSNHHLAVALKQSRDSQDELTNLNKDLEKQVSIRTQELMIAKQNAEQQARTDVLTGLNNRRAFFEYANVLDAQSRRYNHSYVIAMIDIDHFKAVNDTWGHDAGDAALIAIGDLIVKELRETDIIGRIGGEEFAVILPETSAEEGAKLIDRLRKRIEEHTIRTSKSDVKVTTSIGVAAFEDINDPLERIIAHADAALYRAKHAGRNRVESHHSQMQSG